MILKLLSFKSLIESPSKESIIAFLLLYRFITIAYAAFLGLIGIRHIPILTFVIVVAYNVFLMIYRQKALAIVRKYPYLMAIDLAFTFILKLDAGIRSNPYFLYSYSPLFLGSFVFGYTGAFVLASLQSILLVIADYVGGIGPSYLLAFGESVVSYIFLYFLVSSVMAYLSDLINRLEAETIRKEEITSELGQAMRCLELSLAINQLSSREIQVLSLTAQGKTVDEIAIGLELSKNTVKTYLKRINDKLGVSSKQEAVAVMLRQDAETK